MTEATAAQVEETTLLDPLTGQELVNEEVEATPVESAPTDDATQAEPEQPKEDGFQKRINKVTAAKYAAERRAEELERKVRELETAKPAKPAPTLEDFDFDDAAYQAALIESKVEQVISAQTQKQREEAEQAKTAAMVAGFDARVAALGKDDFSEVADAVPELPPGVAAELMASPDGVELIYYIGKHLDVAEKIAGMTPAGAMLELGRISASMKSQPKVTPSAAPEPIAPLKAGSALTADVGDDMPISEWMSKFNG